MEAQPTDARETQDNALNEALKTHPLEDLDGLSIHNQRLARIQEYEEEAISRSEPFAAVIGMGNAYLQRIFEHLGTAVLDEMDSRAHSVEELREFSPEIRLLVKLRNAIETDLALQASDAGQQAAFPNSMQGKTLDTKVATRKRALVTKRWMAT